MVREEGEGALLFEGCWSVEMCGVWQSMVLADFRWIVDRFWIEGCTHTFGWVFHLLVSRMRIGC